MNGLLDVTKEVLLQLLAEKANMDLDAVQATIKMDERNKILEQHKVTRPIWQGTNNRWYTYLPDDTNKRGRRQIAKCSKEKVEDAVVEFYRKINEEQTMTFKKMFEHWIVIQKSKNRSENTITRYRNDYARCIEGSELERMDITNVNEETLIVFINDVIRRKGLTYQALVNVSGNMRGVFKSAKINKVIPVNPFDYIDMTDFYDLCQQTTKTDEEKIVSEEELEKIFKVIDAKLVKHPYGMTLYAILLASLTGLRVGELSGLAWDDIKDTYIHIWQSEKRICEKGKKAIYRIDPFTKTKKERRLPITNEIKELLSAIKDVQNTMGIEAQYVFQNQQGRVHSTSIVTMADTVSQKAQVSNKSIHCYRKTLSSSLRNLNVSTKVVASMLGHTEKVNQKCYSYDTTNMEFKQDKLSEVNRNVINLAGYKGTKDVIESVIKSANM